MEEETNVDIIKYFFENVVISYKEFVESLKMLEAGYNNDLRRAIIVATATYHFREYFPENKKLSVKQTIDICPDYELLSNIVNASKHKVISQNNPKITASKDIYETTAISEYKDEIGLYRIATKKIFAKLSDGSVRDVEEILINVINMWIEILNTEYGSNFPKYKLPDVTIPPKRQSKDGAAKLDLIIHKL